MSKSLSGRMVVELEPDLKHRLYASLAVERRTFKEWLIEQAEDYLSQRHQPLLFAAEPPPQPYLNHGKK